MDKPITAQRLQFDILDLMRSVRGFDTPDGVAVFPKDVVEKIEEELERLYGIEDAAVELLNAIGRAPRKDDLSVQRLMKFFAGAPEPLAEEG